jgi:hypothetical protein
MRTYLKRKRAESRVLRLPLNLYRHHNLEDADVILATYPRSGTTWIRFMLYEAITGESADFIQLRDALPYISSYSTAVPLLPGGGRLLQSHELYGRSVPKVLLQVRDPRSVVVSLYYWRKRNGRVDVDLDTFVADWVEGKRIPWGSWGQHTRYWLNSRSAENGALHLTRYEDLRSDPQPVMEEAIKFLGLEPDARRIETAIDNNTFEQMRGKEETRSRIRVKDDPTTRFVRSGKTSGWRDELSPASQRLVTDSFRSTIEELGYDPNL